MYILYEYRSISFIVYDNSNISKITTEDSIIIIPDFILNDINQLKIIKHEHNIMIEQPNQKTLIWNFNTSGNVTEFIETEHITSYNSKLYYVHNDRLFIDEYSEYSVDHGIFDMIGNYICTYYSEYINIYENDERVYHHNIADVQIVSFCEQILVFATSKKIYSMYYDGGLGNIDTYRIRGKLNNIKKISYHPDLRSIIFIDINNIFCIMNYCLEMILEPLHAMNIPIICKNYLMVVIGLDLYSINLVELPIKLIKIDIGVYGVFNCDDSVVVKYYNSDVVLLDITTKKREKIMNIDGNILLCV